MSIKFSCSGSFFERIFMSKILVVDDDRDIVNAICIYLQGDGYETVKAYNGNEALDKYSECDLVLLDVMMPEMDGIQTITEMRKQSNIPVIFLTAKAEDTDKVVGLNVGADDYITKPFNPAELLARVRSALRRYKILGGIGGEKEESDCIYCGGLCLDDRAKKFTVDGEEVSLTPTEYDIMKLLMENQGKVFSPKDIIREVWHETPSGQEASVAVHIRHLREKIEINPSDPRYIVMVWGRGYKMGESNG